MYNISVSVKIPKQVKRVYLAPQMDESFAFHNSPSEQAKDVIRSAILDRQGVEVMRLSSIQLYDKDACMDFAFNFLSIARIGIFLRG